MTIATTLKLPLLFYIEDNGLGISVRGEMQTPGANIAANLASFGNLLVRDGDGTEPGDSAATAARSAWITFATATDRRSSGSPCRACRSHSGPDNQKGYRTDAEIAEDAKRDPLPRLKRYLVPSRLSRDGMERRCERRGEARRRGRAWRRASARPAPDPAGVKRFVYAEPRSKGDPGTVGGLTRPRERQARAEARLRQRAANRCDSPKPFGGRCGTSSR